MSQDEMVCDYCGTEIQPDEYYRNLAEEGGGYCCYRRECLSQAAEEYGNRDGDETSASSIEDESDSEPLSQGYSSPPQVIPTIRHPAGEFYYDPDMERWVNRSTSERLSGMEMADLAATAGRAAMEEALPGLTAVAEAAASQETGNRFPYNPDGIRMVGNRVYMTQRGEAAATTSSSAAAAPVTPRSSAAAAPVTPRVPQRRSRPVRRLDVQANRRDLHSRLDDEARRAAAEQKKETMAISTKKSDDGIFDIRTINEEMENYAEQEDINLRTIFQSLSDRQLRLTAYPHAQNIQEQEQNKEKIALWLRRYIERWLQRTGINTSEFLQMTPIGRYGNRVPEKPSLVELTNFIVLIETEAIRILHNNGKMNNITLDIWIEALREGYEILKSQNERIIFMRRRIKAINELKSKIREAKRKGIQANKVNREQETLDMITLDETSVKQALSEGNIVFQKDDGSHFVVIEKAALIRSLRDPEYLNSTQYVLFNNSGGMTTQDDILTRGNGSLKFINCRSAGIFPVRGGVMLKRDLLDAVESGRRFFIYHRHDDIRIGPMISAELVSWTTRPEPEHVREYMSGSTRPPWNTNSDELGNPQEEMDLTSAVHGGHPPEPLITFTPASIRSLGKQAGIDESNILPEGKKRARTRKNQNPNKNPRQKKRRRKEGGKKRKTRRRKKKGGKVTRKRRRAVSGENVRGMAESTLKKIREKEDIKKIIKLNLDGSISAGLAETSRDRSFSDDAVNLLQNLRSTSNNIEEEEELDMDSLVLTPRQKGGKTRRRKNKGGKTRKKKRRKRKKTRRKH